MEIELCCASKRALTFLKKYDFTSIEFCKKLQIGGLTPNINWIKEILPIENTKVRVLIRSRKGNFCYSLREKLEMMKQIENFAYLNLSINGFVVGALNTDNTLDISWLSEIKTNFPKFHFTFHRAFDIVEDKNTAVNQLIDIGFERILTSGNSNFCIEKNIVELKNLINIFGGKIEIALGGGITSENVVFLKNETNCNSIHFSGCVNKNGRLIPDKNKINNIFFHFKSKY